MICRVEISKFFSCMCTSFVLFYEVVRQIHYQKTQRTGWGNSKGYYPHSFCRQETQHTTWTCGRATRGVRRQKQEWGEGWKGVGPVVITGVSWRGREDSVHGLGLVDLNNFGRFWPAGIVPGCLAPDSGLIKVAQYCLRGVMGQTEVWFWIG